MSYQIAGRAVKSQWLALGTLLGTPIVVYPFLGGGDKKPASAKPAPIAVPGASSDEQEFIKNFVEAAEKEGHAATAKH
ncbi:hypothetical protein FRB95_012678 [Tulasnella sp. JGI-2019a]|nr:hypothetical protein FRB95_012678 [Tulasnella sp. JGI-2019a]